MWNGYGVCSSLASSGEPPLLHMTTLTTARSRISRRLHKPTRSQNLLNALCRSQQAERTVEEISLSMNRARPDVFRDVTPCSLWFYSTHGTSDTHGCRVNSTWPLSTWDQHVPAVLITAVMLSPSSFLVSSLSLSAIILQSTTCTATARVIAWLTAHIPHSD